MVVVISRSAQKQTLTVINYFLSGNGSINKDGADRSRQPLMSNL